MWRETDPFSLDPDEWMGLEAETWNGLGFAGFNPVFIDGFESGDTTAWSAEVR